MNSRGETSRLGLVFPVVPFRIAADGIEDHPTNHPVSARDLDGQAGQGHEGNDKEGIFFAPEPCVHAAHRSSHHQPQMIDAEPFGQEPVLRRDHVVVVVVRKPGVKAVARLARLAVPDVVGKDDEIPGSIQQLSGTKENTAELRREKSASAPPRAVKYQYRIPHYPARISERLSERAVMKLQFRQFLTVLKAKATHREISLNGIQLLRRDSENARAQQN